MQKSRQVYDIMIAEEFRSKDGKERVQYHRAGIAFDNVRGGLNCEIVPGMALSGRFVIFPKEDKEKSG